MPDKKIQSDNIEKERAELSVAATAVPCMNSSEEPIASKRKKANGKSEKEKQNAKDDYDEFPDLAALMNTTVEALKDEFFLFQIRKLMGRMGKVIVRYNVPEKELERCFVNSSLLELGEIVVSPVYLQSCAKQIEKNHLHNLRVGSLIGFPFGESSLKSKTADIKDSANFDADDITVVIPSVTTTAENAKILKKQAKKIGRSYRKGAGIALNATDLTDDQIKRAVKTAERTKLSFITFIFGETALSELVNRMTFINSIKGNKKIKVLANVDSAEGIMQLFKLDVDVILTPYADVIGKELIERFNVKGVKLR